MKASDLAAKAAVGAILAVMFLLALPGLILWAPFKLGAMLIRRGGEDTSSPLRPRHPPRPLRRLSRVGAWFQTEQAQGLMTLVCLAVILAVSLVAVFGMGADPVGILIVAVLIALGASGIIRKAPGGGGG